MRKIMSICLCIAITLGGTGCANEVKLSDISKTPETSEIPEIAESKFWAAVGTYHMYSRDASTRESTAYQAKWDTHGGLELSYFDMNSREEMRVVLDEY